MGTQREREHVIEIARSNRTVGSYLDTAPEAAFTVQSIRAVLNRC
jgi:hypothetical protein